MSSPLARATGERLVGNDHEPVDVTVGEAAPLGQRTGHHHSDHLVVDGGGLGPTLDGISMVLLQGPSRLTRSMAGGATQRVRQLLRNTACIKQTGRDRPRLAGARGKRGTNRKVEVQAEQLLLLPGNLVEAMGLEPTNLLTARPSRW